VEQAAITNEAVGSKSKRYNFSIIRKGNTAEYACPEVKRWGTPPLDCLVVG